MPGAERFQREKLGFILQNGNYTFFARNPIPRVDWKDPSLAKTKVQYNGVSFIPGMLNAQGCAFDEYVALPKQGHVPEGEKLDSRAVVLSGTGTEIFSPRTDRDGQHFWDGSKLRAMGLEWHEWRFNDRNIVVGFRETKERAVAAYVWDMNNHFPPTSLYRLLPPGLEHEVVRIFPRILSTVNDRNTFYAVCTAFVLEGGGPGKWVEKKLIFEINADDPLKNPIVTQASF